jgi:peptide/nickel transport system permease protein
LKFLWFLGGRLLQLVPVLIGITAVAFLLLRVMPGDPATLMLGARGNAEDIAALTRQLGLDRPLWQQYLGFLGDIVTGSFGLSIASRRAVGIEMVERLWPTLALVGLSTVIAVVLTVPLALLSAVRRGGWADKAIKLVFIAAMSMPAFWLGLLLVLLLSIALPIFPVSGYGDGFLGHLRHLVLPALVIGLGTAALAIRALRSSIIGVLAAALVDSSGARRVGEESVAWCRSRWTPQQ